MVSLSSWFSSGLWHLLSHSKLPKGSCLSLKNELCSTKAPLRLDIWFWQFLTQNCPEHFLWLSKHPASILYNMSSHARMWVVWLKISHLKIFILIHLNVNTATCGWWLPYPSVQSYSLQECRSGPKQAQRENQPNSTSGVQFYDGRGLNLLTKNPCVLPYFIYKDTIK